MNLNELDRFKFSFRNALVGIRTAFNTQKNLRIHLIISSIVVIAAFMFKISYSEWMIIILTIMLVIISELFNTAIEFAVDLFSPDYNHLAKKAKDVSAAGVLVTSIFAALIGLIIFIPKIIKILQVIF